MYASLGLNESTSYLNHQLAWMSYYIPLFYAVCDTYYKPCENSQLIFHSYTWDIGMENISMLQCLQDSLCIYSTIGNWASSWLKVTHIALIILIYLWPCDATYVLIALDLDQQNIFQPSPAHRSRSTQVEVRVCCLTATNPYLNQCSLVINLNTRNTF